MSVTCREGTNFLDISLDQLSAQTKHNKIKQKEQERQCTKVLEILGVKLNTQLIEN